ncbi:MAG: dihydroflavonol-4-reductase [Bradymonadia bacterium]|jgi:dihydroflavonol-4-reductase
MKVLVTGGSGFLGEAVVRCLLSAGHHATVFSRTEPLVGSAWFAGSVEERRTLFQAAEGHDAIVHLAGRVTFTRREGYRPLRELHVQGTVNAVEAARSAGIRRVVFASTSGVVGVHRSRAVVADDSSPHAARTVRAWPYYLTKIEAERAAFDRGAALDLEVIAMRPSLMLGPGDRRYASTGVVRDFLTRSVPIVPTGGLACVDVRDAAAAFVSALEHANPARSYLLGAENLSFEELFGRLEQISGVKAPRLKIPSSLVIAATRAVSPLTASRDTLDPVVAEMSRHYWFIDSVAARQDLGFSPRQLNETLSETIDWIRQQNAM